MEPWYKVATPRAEVREGRSFNPDEFAIALEQVVVGKAPFDYRRLAQTRRGRSARPWGAGASKLAEPQGLRQAATPRIRLERDSPY